MIALITPMSGMTTRRMHAGSLEALRVTRPKAVDLVRIKDPTPETLGISWEFKPALQAFAIGPTPSVDPTERSPGGYWPGRLRRPPGGASCVCIRSQCSSLQDSAGAHFRTTPRSRFSVPFRGPLDGISASASRRRTCASSQLCSATRTPLRPGPASRHGTDRAMPGPSSASGAPPRPSRGADWPGPATAS